MAMALDQLPSRYLPAEELGQGGFGRVLRARDQELNRDVALKVQACPSPEDASALFAEAKLMAGISHPNLVEIYDFGWVGGLAYLVLEYLPGASLQEAPPEDPRRALEEIAAGLGAIHAKGFVHGDLKPANLMWDAQGRVKILDFGGARLARTQGPTQTSILGTPGYLAPEVLGGDPKGTPSDWFAWGVCGYFFLEGRLPFSASALVEAFQEDQILEPEFSSSDFEPLQGALRRALSLDPEDRPRGPKDALRGVPKLSPKEPRTQEGARTPEASSPSPRGDSKDLPRSRGRALWMGAGLLGLALAGWLGVPARRPSLAAASERTTPQVLRESLRRALANGLRESFSARGLAALEALPGWSEAAQVRQDSKLEAAYEDLDRTLVQEGLEVYFAPFRPPPASSRWLREAQENLDRALVLRHQLDQDRGWLRDYLPEAAQERAEALGGWVGLEDLVRSLAVDPEARAGLTRALAGGGEATHRALVAISQALFQEEPKSREVSESKVWKELRVFLLPHRWSGRTRTLLGVDPSRLPGRLPGRILLWQGGIAEALTRPLPEPKARIEAAFLGESLEDQEARAKIAQWRDLAPLVSRGELAP